MAVYEHLAELHFLPAHPFPGPGEEQDLPDPETVAWYLAVEPWEADEPYEELWQRFMKTVDPSRVRALIIGTWGDDGSEDSSVAVRLLVEAKEQLSGLVAVFLGDITQDECEISWIHQCDVSPILKAYPGLEELGVRGGEELVFPPVRHEKLRTLALEAGGLPAEVVRNVVASELPALECLELWLGVESYGGDATVADLAPLLAGGRFPALRHLGLQNSEIQDEIAAAVAAAPVVAQLKSLSLSMGTLTDDGAEALLTGQPLTHLDQLDLRHHFLSDAMGERLRQALEPAGVEVDLSEQEQPDRWGDEEMRYVAVSE